MKNTTHAHTLTHTLFGAVWMCVGEFNDSRQWLRYVERGVNDTFTLVSFCVRVHAYHEKLTLTRTSHTHTQMQAKRSHKHTHTHAHTACVRACVHMSSFTFGSTNSAHMCTHARTDALATRMHGASVRRQLHQLCETSPCVASAVSP